MSNADVKVAVLTAAGSGMGAACARKLAADGWKVAILSSSGKGEAPATALSGFGVTGSPGPRRARPPRGRRHGPLGPH